MLTIRIMGNVRVEGEKSLSFMQMNAFTNSFNPLFLCSQIPTSIYLLNPKTNVKQMLIRHTVSIEAVPLASHINHQNIYNRSRWKINFLPFDLHIDLQMTFILLISFSGIQADRTRCCRFSVHINYVLSSLFRMPSTLINTFIPSDTRGVDKWVSEGECCLFFSAQLPSTVCVTTRRPEVVHKKPPTFSIPLSHQLPQWLVPGPILNAVVTLSAGPHV